MARPLALQTRRERAACRRVPPCRYNDKSDVWSMGCLLYELATLRSPFYKEGVNFYVLGKRIMSRQFEPISGFSAEMVDLVDRMLQVGPLRRFFGL